MAFLTAYSPIAPFILTKSSFSSTSVLAMAQQQQDFFRSDGVRITHDPYAPCMAEKYGLPGQTDKDGFDPYADTVGPGIYGDLSSATKMARLSSDNNIKITIIDLDQSMMAMDTHLCREQSMQVQKR